MKKDILLLVLMCFAVGCKPDRVIKIDLQSVINKQIIDLKKDKDLTVTDFKLCDFITVDWDSLIVLLPYETEKRIRKLPFRNNNKVEEIYEGLGDESSLLLYIRNGTIVGYSPMIRPYLYVGFLGSSSFMGFNLFVKNECNNLSIRKYFKNDKMYFEIIKNN